MSSFYDVIRRCNKFDRDIGSLWEFCLLDSHGPVGYMLPEFVAEMRWEGTSFHVSKTQRRVHLIPRVGIDGDVVDICRLEFVELCEKNRGILCGVEKWLRKSADYHPLRGLEDHLVGIKMPSALRGVFGIVTTGTHLNVYTVKRVDGRPKMHIWVSRRSQNVTYAGKLDQIVAGAMDPADSMDPLRTLQREAMEEAQLTIDVDSRTVTAQGTFVGTIEQGPRISFYDKKDAVAGSEQGQLEPGVRFTFDLEVDPSFIPQPSEPDAIAGFFLKPVDDVKRDLRNAEWKPNCGLVMLDFLLRKGLIRPDDDERFGMLRQGLQRELPFRNV
ncbi:NUDIX hydrolase domain-containingprotein [Purpureocillium lavendulum]|uniref:NUDIX hydrolase domain-containingprotein n=1 Tax=Purpureocillium lavendulum TaxID=1247861 RepID=A0AB34G5R7_9HYPO|nr:NUDIX hydrolase domain-containingprotein [Purpureocillium lavendulum]